MPSGKELGTRLLWDLEVHFGDGNTSVPCSLDATARYDYRLPTFVSPPSTEASIPWSIPLIWFLHQNQQAQCPYIILWWHAQILNPMLGHLYLSTTPETNLPQIVELESLLLQLAVQGDTRRSSYHPLLAGYSQKHSDRHQLEDFCHPSTRNLAQAPATSVVPDSHLFRPIIRLF